jgi:hypothetical protein
VCEKSETNCSLSNKEEKKEDIMKIWYLSNVTYNIAGIIRDVLRTRDPVDILCRKIILKIGSPAVYYGGLRIYDITIKKNWKNKRNNKPTLNS